MKANDFDHEMREASVAPAERLSTELEAMIQLHQLSALSLIDENLDVFLSKIVDTAIAVTGASFGNVQLIDPASQVLRIVAQRGFSQRWVDFWNSVPEGKGSCGLSLQRGERIIVENVEKSPIFTGAALKIQLEAGVRAVQSTPLVSRSGKPLGMFSTHYRRPQRPDEGTLRVLDLFARQAADIIEHVQAIASLRESEERFRAMADGIPLMIWVSDCNGQARFINKAYMEFYRITLEELKLRGWQSLIHPDDLVRYSEEVSACLREKRSLHAEVRVKRHDGEWRTVEVFAQPRSLSSGEFLGIAGCSVDITDRKQSEEALRRISTELRQTLNTAATGLTHCSRDLRYLSANPAYALFVGLPLEQIVGKPIVEVMGKAAFEIIEPRIKRVLLGETVEYEDEVPLANTRKWVRVTYTPERDFSGNVVGWVASVMDITERKRAEEASRQQASLLSLSFDAIIVWQFDNGIESWNQGAETLYGYTEQEAIGKKTHDLLKTVFPVSLSETEAVLKESGKWEGELRHQTKDGRELTVSARLQCVRNDHGTIRVLETNRDITERKHMDLELAEEGRRKDEFLSFLGHELRNPLATISTATQLLSGDVSDVQRISLHKMMDRQVNVMRRLLDDLLDLVRITHGHIRLQKVPVDLAVFLKNLRDAIHSTVAEREQEMIFHLPSEIVTFEADEVRLEQIAINLLKNASKYTPRGGTIEFSGAKEGSQVVLRCKDNGRGIPREMQQRIFEPFTRLGSFSDSPGDASLGIGLALVKQLVELHGGTISVESGGNGMGSEFVVRLPAEPGALEQPVAAVPMLHSTPQRSRLIAVVDDNSDLAEAMALALEQAGYEVKVFADAFSALAGISDLKPHAMLLDIGLPDMTGHQLVAMLKAKPHLQDTLFIGLSGYNRRDTSESAGAFDHYFIKPVSIHSLLSFLENAAPPHRVLEKIQPIRVLLIDDHAELATSMAALLRTEGFEIRIALSGSDGLKAAQEFRPQLTVCDLRLPDMNGLDLIRALRSNPLTRDFFAVVLTAMSDHEIREFNHEAKRMGIDEFMGKPLTREAVRRLAAKLKGQQRVQDNRPPGC